MLRELHEAAACRTTLSPEWLASDAIAVPVHVRTIAGLSTAQRGRARATSLGAIAIAPAGDSSFRC